MHLCPPRLTPGRVFCVGEPSFVRFPAFLKRLMSFLLASPWSMERTKLNEVISKRAPLLSPFKLNGHTTEP